MSRQINALGFRANPGDEEQYKFDAFAHATTVIQEEHRLIHDGMYFSTNYGFTSLANGANLDILIAVPANSFPHLRAWAYSLEDGPCNFTLYEGTTTSDDGTALTSTNNNRNSTNAPNAVWTHTPTISGVGTAILENHYVPDPGGGFLSGSPGTNFSDVSEEWILKPSTKYLLRLTNNSGGAIDGSVYIVHYELGYDH